MDKEHPYIDRLSANQSVVAPFISVDAEANNWKRFVYILTAPATPIYDPDALNAFMETLFPEIPRGGFDQPARRHTGSSTFTFGYRAFDDFMTESGLGRPHDPMQRTIVILYPDSELYTIACARQARRLSANKHLLSPDLIQKLFP
ncbi:MAG: hypothetical protein NTX72_02875 [Candidatus Uhrbacteria bacterium]|nr:hypothetical protein [Candidatus Uhrbacteria bacterium]